MKMKKVLIVFTLMLTLGMSVQAASQKHRHTPRGTELVDTTKQSSGVDAFSDTTSIDSAYSSSFDDDWDSDDPVEKGVGKMLESMFSDTKLFSGMVIAIVAIVIIFLLAPLLIIIAIFYFVNKNRKEKMKLAQMAMEKGQPIPDELLNNQPDEVSDEYQKGMRQCFVGVGLMIFLYFAAGTIGFGIGALVFCIGLGKVLAAKSVGKRTPNNNNNDDLTQQDYD
jgi:uncharacterized protein YxeA